MLHDNVLAYQTTNLREFSSENKYYRTLDYQN